MELLVLNTNFESIAIIDNFESTIWSDQYYGCGDFEIYTKASEELISMLQQTSYLWTKDSEHVMIIEDMEIKFDVEDGDYLIITGRSLESILDRRIIWNQTVLTGNFQNGIKKLLDENIISPVQPERTIPNFIFEFSEDSRITELTVEAQFNGENLYDSVRRLCLANDLGFKITLSNDNKFVFKLYLGEDRSHDQLDNPYVIFSPKFENIMGTSYSISNRPMKTVTLVVGEGEGATQKKKIVGGGEALARREMYTDAKNISKTVDGVTIPDITYLEQLEQRGLEDLVENDIKTKFDGQVDATRMFKYGVDFFMGDIVQIASNYGIEGKARVTGVIFSHSVSGLEMYPTFTII